MQSCIVLMGIKHCGKSTQANLLARHFSVPAFDTDDLILEMTGKTPRQIYTELGQEGFKKAEKEACLELKKRLEKLSVTDTDGSRADNEKKYLAVAATGGGICNNPEAVEILKQNGILVFLNADEHIAIKRIIREVKTDVTGKLFNLPAYIAKENPCTTGDVRKIFHRFYSERQKVYGSICQITVDMGNASKKENCNAIIQALTQKA